MRRNFNQDFISGTMPDGDTVTKRGERICPMCGKDFLIHCSLEDWGYQGPMRGHVCKMGRVSNVLFCSYKCMRKAEKELNIPRDIVELAEAMELADKEARQKEADKWNKHYKRKKTLAELDAES